MTSFDSRLCRLVDQTTPSQDVKNRVSEQIQGRIQPTKLVQSVKSLSPSTRFTDVVRDRMLGRISNTAQAWLPKAAHAQHISLQEQASLKNRVLLSLKPAPAPIVHRSIKWAAALAIVLLAVRSLPLVLLAPVTRADLGVQLLPSGPVEVLVGGVWTTVSSAQVLRGPTLVKTGDSQATIVMNDDGVFRLRPNTTVRLHDVSDRPQSIGITPTLTLMRGQLWILGLLPPSSQSIDIETSQGILSVSAGSISLQDDGVTVVAAAFDRGATFARESGADVAFVSGERVVAHRGSPFFASKFPPAIATTSWVNVNLDQDAVHRADIAALQEEARAKSAGILPPSILYPAKRLAEEVDVLFTLGDEARTEKRVAQANSRLNEALTLMNEGNADAAALPLTEYRETLVALAGDSGDNLVKSLLKKQIEEASSSLAVVDPDNQLPAVRQAVLDITSAIPDADLKPKEIEGYVLVDRLAALNRSLRFSKDPQGALSAYADIQPFLQSLLSKEDGTHPLLQREARSLLASTSTLLAEIHGVGTSSEMQSMQADIAQYVPAETDEDFVSDSELDAVAQKIYNNVIVNLSYRVSRDNQLAFELEKLRRNSNRGTILRRLKGLLPPNSHWAMRVEEDIRELGGELQD